MLLVVYKETGLIAVSFLLGYLFTWRTLGIHHYISKGLNCVQFVV